VVKSNAKNKKRNSRANTNPAKHDIKIKFFLKTIGLLNIFIHIIKKKNAITDLAPAKNTGFNPVFTTLITTWFIAKSTENKIKAHAPNKSILVFLSIV
jgi:hypothetical protein